MAVTRAARGARPRHWPGVAAWALWALGMLGLAAAAWLSHLLRQASRSELAFLGTGIIPEVVAAVSAATVGAVLASRRPAHPVGWLLLGLGLLVPASDSTYAYTHYGVMARPGALPAAAYLAGISNGLFFLSLSCAGFILLLTPTGSLPSPRWRWWARVAAAAALLVLVGSALDPHPLVPEDPAFTNPLARPVPLARALGAAGSAGILIVLGALLAAAWSLVGRFRRAGGVERQQLRWLAMGAVLAALALLAALGGVATSKMVVVQAATGTCMALLPLATGAAILRYRLYDLDRIISRTLAYGLLTVLLGGGYAGVVLGLGQVVGRDSSLLVAGATLAVARVFQPARRRIQGVVDRRFNRHRYDAAQTVQAFSARLRQQVDLDTLTSELLGVVDQTMQPTQVSLWLRPSVSASPDQRGAGASRAAPQPTASPSVRTGL
ncbi:MAG TPA: hypothetical protein VFA45_10485 [Actinomycetes bacterium]|nr:hypothetical protein [Actinomycetes bacterium]